MKDKEFSVLKFYASTTDRVGSKLFYEHIVYLAKQNNIVGVTVYRGVMGYGLSSSHINSSKFWEFTEKLPIVIEMIDETSKLKDFYNLVEPELESMGKGCLVYMHTANVHIMKKGNNKQQ